MIADRYRLIARLGSGGMGEVWRAYDERLHRTVAVKRLHLPAELTEVQAETVRRRTMREGRVAARLQHRHSITVFDVIDDGGRPYLVMEYLESTSLAGLLDERGSLPPLEVARLGAQAAAALAAAHEAGVVHRDVKPGNVLLGEDGTVKITDFGISRVVEDVAGTTTRGVAGTPAYLSPEVGQGKQGSYASDVFSLGATLYAAVEGKAPYGDADNVMKVLFRVASGDIDPPTRAGPMTEVLVAMMATDPGQRPTMAQARDALAAVAGSAEDGAAGAVPLDLSPGDADPTLRTDLPPPVNPTLVDEPLPLVDPTPRAEPAADPAPREESPPQAEPAPPAVDPAPQLDSQQELQQDSPSPVDPAWRAESPPAAGPASQPPADDPTQRVEPSAGVDPRQRADRPVGGPQQREGAIAARPDGHAEPRRGVPVAAPSDPAEESAGNRKRGALLVGAMVLVAAVVAAVVLWGQDDDPGAASPGASTTTAEVAPTSEQGAGQPPAPAEPPPASAEPTTTTATPPPTTTQATTTRAVAPAPPATATPQKAIADYYALMPGDLAAGWERLTPKYQQSPAGGRKGYSAFWGSISAVTVSAVSARDNIVEATVDYAFKDGRDVRERHRYVLVRAGSAWKIDESTVLSSS
ncbi:protein kinase domain-containing protein [Actinokineospora sp. 24-640]